MNMYIVLGHTSPHNNISSGHECSHLLSFFSNFLIGANFEQFINRIPHQLIITLYIGDIVVAI